jgi:hypothetical protein
MRFHRSGDGAWHCFGNVHDGDTGRAYAITPDDADILPPPPATPDVRRPFAERIAAAETLSELDAAAEVEAAIARRAQRRRLGPAQQIVGGALASISMAAVMLATIGVIWLEAPTRVEAQSVDRNLAPVEPRPLLFVGSSPALLRAADAEGPEPKVRAPDGRAHALKIAIPPPRSLRLTLAPTLIATGTRADVFRTPASGPARRLMADASDANVETDGVTMPVRNPRFGRIAVATGVHQVTSANLADQGLIPPAPRRVGPSPFDTSRRSALGRGIPKPERAAAPNGIPTPATQPIIRRSPPAWARRAFAPDN